MIPLRVYLKNFLCYQQHEFRFDGHPVWLLYGDNGVGKSAIFDGMLYALFGEHKRTAGRNTATDLIRNGESSFRVEFDFEYDQKQYRIWRTRARTGPTKQGVSELLNGNAVPVRDVNGVRELDAWVSRTLSLTYDTFVSAVLLRQGAAEKLIDADKDARRQLFRGIIDLDPYIRLHEAVCAARTEVTGAMRSLRAAFERMPMITDGQISDATQARDDAQTAWENARTAEQTTRDRLGHARLWEQLNQTATDVRTQLAAAADRAARATDMESVVRRLHELRTLVPALTAVADRREDLSAAEQELQRVTAEQTVAIDRQAAISSSIGQEQEKAATHRNRIVELDRQIGLSENVCQRLRDQIQHADSAADLHTRLAARRAELATYEAGLDAQCTQAEAAVADAEAAHDALPNLETVASSSADYRQAVADAAAAEARAVGAAAEIEQLVAAEAQATEAAISAATRKTLAEQAVAVADDRLADAIRRKDRFATVTGAARCSECGQPIDAEHARREQIKLQQNVTDATADAERCRQEVEAATQADTNTRTACEQCETDRRAAEHIRDDATGAHGRAALRVTNAQTRFDAALARLSEAFQRRVPGIDVAGFPTATDLTNLRQLTAALPTRRRERDRLTERRGNRETCAADITTLEGAVRAVGSPADVTAARADLAQHEQTVADLQTERTQADQHRTDAEQAARTLAPSLAEATTTVTTLSTTVGRAESAVTSAELRLAQAEQAVPAPYRANLAAPIAPLAEELERLESSSVEAEYAAMADDRTLHAERERQLNDAEEQIARVPEDARRRAAEVAAELTIAEQGLHAADKLRTTAVDQLATLTRQRTDRQEAEQRLAAEERNHTLHDRLAGLLGDRGIQLDLVRDAERRIIEFANDVLVRVSCGDLRFDAPDPASDRSFDLSVRRMGSPGPIAVANLSGGQRFRVAVSLALAVCRFANGERRPLESVIIDEGFGSLDREGRMAMITELRDGQTLSQMFKRVLVVSHQEDFAAAFPVGYRLWSEGGLTKVETFGLL